MSTPTMKRPGGVSAVIILIWIAALINIAIGVWLLTAWIGDNPSITDASGNAMKIPTFYLIINGLLSVLLGVMYIWLARLAGIGSQQAHVIIQALAVINIVFGFFRLPYGWSAIVINAIILFLVSTPSAKQWFLQNR
jgi:hypothetical protein